MHYETKCTMMNLCLCLVNYSYSGADHGDGSDSYGDCCGHVQKVRTTANPRHAEWVSVFVRRGNSV